MSLQMLQVKTAPYNNFESMNNFKSSKYN